MSVAPHIVDAAALRRADRQPPLPFSIAFGSDNASIQVSRILRILPGKRIVGEGRFNGESVLVKLFIAAGSERHWQRELQGVAALTAARLPTPEIIASGKLTDGGHAVLSRFLDGADSLADLWNAAASPKAALDTITPALAIVGRMHNAGLVQDDLHFGNFLIRSGSLYVIDGDAVRAISPGTPLDAGAARDNLAILLAQLPAEWDTRQTQLLDIYHRSTGIRLTPSALSTSVRQARERRMQDFLAKSARDCTIFAVQRGFTRFVAIQREHAAALAPLVADPDRAIAQGALLKDGGSATVARCGNETLGPLVIKRYNLKNRRHALSRAWRPSRAWHSWREGLRLHFLGIATPQPLALIEQRAGPLRRRAWLVTAYCDGPDLLAHLDPASEPPPAEAAAIVRLFTTLQRERISHGDLKATNLLWHGGQVMLIDLDAVCRHRTDSAYMRAWRRDRARLLRNWPADSALCRWLDAALPPA